MLMDKKAKVPVTLRALVQRINRKLAKDGEALRATRGGRDRSELGNWYIVDLDGTFIATKDVDPEKLGRRLSVLRDNEEVVE
jgi:hypothetical protein